MKLAQRRLEIRHPLMRSSVVDIGSAAAGELGGEGVVVRTLHPRCREFTVILAHHRSDAGANRFQVGEIALNHFCYLFFAKKNTRHQVR